MRIIVVKLDNPGWISMAKRINALVVVPSYEQNCSTVRKQSHKFLIAGIQILKLVDNQMLNIG